MLAQQRSNVKAVLIQNTKTMTDSHGCTGPTIRVVINAGSRSIVIKLESCSFSTRRILVYIHSFGETTPHALCFLLVRKIQRIRCSFSHCTCTLVFLCHSCIPVPIHIVSVDICTHTHTHTFQHTPFNTHTHTRNELISDLAKQLVFRTCCL